MGLVVKEVPARLLPSWPCRKTLSGTHAGECDQDRQGAPGHLSGRHLPRGQQGPSLTSSGPPANPPPPTRPMVLGPGLSSEQCHLGPFLLRICSPAGQTDADQLLTGPGGPEPDLEGMRKASGEKGSWAGRGLITERETGWGQESRERPAMGEESEALWLESEALRPH